IHVLERAHVAERLRPGAADADERHLRALRVRDRRHDVRHAGPRGDRAHARPPGDARVAVRGVPGGLLVPDVDDADALVDAAVVDRLDVPSAEREQMRRAVTLERLSDEPTAMNERHPRDSSRYGPVTVDEAPPPRKSRWPAMRSRRAARPTPASP